MKNQPISRIMTPEPATVAPTNNIASAERIMRERGCHHVPVVDDRRVVGMISACDLLKALLVEPNADTALKQSSLQATRVADVMRRDVVVLSETSTILDAAKALQQGDIHALAVLAWSGAVVGIVTSSDLIETLLDALEHSTNDESSEARSGNGHEASEEQVQLLRQVFRATIQYLESGCAEIEHGRLLRAVNEAREGTVSADLLS